MLENGQVSYSESPMTGGRYPVNTMATFMCNHGYILDGSQTRTCQPSLEWSQQTPICNRGNEENVLIIYHSRHSKYIWHSY